MSWLSKYEEKRLLKTFGMQYEGYKTSELGDGYEANECRGDFAGWLAGSRYAQKIMKEIV